uniref:Integrase catalytic domain-containing protein n=1 Tax=Tanacetum cinerariifolium TaxID=118510 RepID=A0A6L2KD10_TANCI|nr:hypothetical protein [Tanacetum cinerariifolium]
MAAIAQNTNNTTIRLIFLAEKLTGSNFTNWYRNLRIVLRYEKKINFMEQPIGPAPDPETADPYTIDKYYKTVNLKQKACFMLSKQAKQELFETVKAFHACKQEEGIPKKAETPDVLAIREGKIQKDKRKPQGAKDKDKGKNKLAYAPKPKIPPPSKRYNLVKDSICHHCKEVGHWRRNYLPYQAELKKRNEASMASTSDTPVVSPLPHLDDDSDDGEILNELIEYENAGTLHRERIINSSDGDDLAFECVIGFRKFTAYLDPFLPMNIISRKAYNTIVVIFDEKKLGSIVSQLTPPYTPQHNEVSERKNQTLLDMVRSMMNLTTLPKSFWGYTPESAARILNMVLTKKVKRTPYKIWHGKAPKLSSLRVWGCYPKETMVYYFYYASKNKIFVARNAELFENSLIVQEVSWNHGPLKISGSDEGLELIQEEDTQPSENTSKEHDEVVPIEDLNEPPNYKAALSDPEYDKWFEAMNTKMMKDNQVWILVELPPNEKILKKFKMENSKNGYTPMMEKPGYRKSQGAKTPSEVQRMQRVPYASANVSIMNTKDMVLMYGAKPEAGLKVSCYADASFQTDKDDMKSQTGYVKYHYIREVIQERKIVFKKVHTDDNVAGPFTKPMSFDKHFEHAMAIGIVPASSLM